MLQLPSGNVEGHIYVEQHKKQKWPNFPLLSLSNNFIYGLNATDNSCATWPQQNAQGILST